MSDQRLVSIVLCEDVLFDLDHNLTIYRVFRRVSSAQFPALMRRLQIVTTWLGEGSVHAARADSHAGQGRGAV